MPKFARGDIIRCIDTQGNGTGARLSHKGGKSMLFRVISGGNLLNVLSMENPLEKPETAYSGRFLPTTHMERDNTGDDYSDAIAAQEAMEAILK